MPKLPPPASQPDPDGARILYDQAKKLIADSRFPQAFEMLKTVVSLDPDGAEAWCDLGVCSNQMKDVRMAAACLVAAHDRLANEKDPGQGKKLESRVATLLAAADPKMKKVEDLDKEFAAAASNLSRQASASGDKATADEIDGFLKTLGSASSPRPVAAAGIDLRTIKLDVQEGVRLERQANSLAIYRDPNFKPKDGNAPPIPRVFGTFDKLTYAGNIRTRWRLEPMNPKNPGPAYFKCWPFRAGTNSTDAAITLSYDCGVFGNDYKPFEAKGKILAKASKDQLKGALRADGVYEVCFEKIANRVAAWVGTLKIIEVEISQKEIAETDKTPVTLFLATGALGYKLVLLELATGPLTAYNPPKPDGK